MKPTWLGMVAWGSLCAFVGYARADEGYQIRLAVDSGKSTVVRGRNLVVVDGDVRDVLRRDVSGSIRLEAGREGLEVPGVSEKPRSVLFESPHPLEVGERSLVGTVEVIHLGERRLMVVNRLPIERYLQGLLGAEMPANWHREALRAQAVASRTFAVRRRLERESEAYDLSSSTLDQVYAGIEREDARTRKAVLSTRGEVLTHGGVPAQTLFHSCCGGRTLSSEDVFGNRVSYLRSLEDTACAGCPRETWSMRLPLSSVAVALRRTRNWKGGITGVRPRGKSIVFEGQGRRFVLTRHELRHLVGPARVPSPDFTWARDNDDLVLSGRGHGHGVGMCQWGANGRAKRGHDYRRILMFYFPGCELRKMY